MLKDTIQQDLTKALKEKDQAKSSLLRFINSEIKNEEIAQKTRDKGLSNEAVEKVIMRQLKQIKDSRKLLKAHLKLPQKMNRKLQLVLKTCEPKELNVKSTRE